MIHGRPAARLARLGLLALAGAALGGCFATRADVKLLQTDLAAQRTERARSDSAMHGQISALLGAIRATHDSVDEVGARLARLQGDVVKMQGDLRGELYAMGQQLIQIQELTGQSTRRLQEMRASLEARQEAAVLTPVAPTVAAPAPTTGATGAAAPPPTGTPATGTTTPPPVTPQPAPAGGAPSAPASGTPGPNRLFQLSLDQMRRGSFGAARSGFEELIHQYPTSDLVGESLFYVGESYRGEGNADAADSVYKSVVEKHPESTRAPTALYKHALTLAERGDANGAKAALTQLVEKYPRSDEAVLARDRLRILK